MHLRIIAPLAFAALLAARGAEPAPLTDKTLVAWVSLENLTQRGGSVLTIDDQHGHFDGIVFGELAPGKWMAGSEFWRRTGRAQESSPAETADTTTSVQIAIVYSGTQVSIYRNGKDYAQYRITQPQKFGNDSAVTIGLRHLESKDASRIAGSIWDGRIYDIALSRDQIAALKPNEPSTPMPLAWWNFKNGNTKDAMGRFPAGKLVGNARVESGKLILDGTDSAMIAGQFSPAVPRYDSPIHYRPKVGALADTIPIFWNGHYHIFYLRAGVGKVPWEHIVSTDLIHWNELPSALLPDGAPDGPDGQNMFTGSVMEHDGTFHIFYTGDNGRNKRGAECVMHATSTDLISWTKHPDQAFYPDEVTYQKGGFRDPYVFWNDEAHAFWMILCAMDVKTGKPVQGVAESGDLVTWKQIAPLTYDSTPPGASECPDLFKIGDTWYVIHSPSIGTTDVCFSKDIRGPYYLSPTPAIDTSILYAAKRMFDGKRHIITGWIRDLGGSRDNGEPQWGGDQSMPREVYPGPNGQLYFRPVPEAIAQFDHVLLSSATDSSLTNLSTSIPTPDNYLLDCNVQLDSGAEFTVTMRQDDADEESGYRLVLRPAKQEAEIASTKFSHPRKIDVDFSKPVKIQAFVQGSIIECFIQDQYAFSCRAYGYRSGNLKMTVTGGTAKVMDLAIKTHEVPNAVVSNATAHCASAGTIAAQHKPQAMFFKSDSLGGQWDTWLYYHAGTYYLYLLAGTGRWDGIGMATSADGCNWTELGRVLTKADGVTWLGTGSAWKSPNFARDKKYYINFSECRGPRQTIFFAESTDLVHWKRLPDDEFVQDERWYERNGRWDCIYTIPRKGGGFYGYWTATPKAETGGHFGFGQSTDGIHWEALPPPKVEGAGTGEVGAVEKLGKRYYMMFGMGGKMVTLVANQPEGPFTAAKKNFVLMAGNTYFSRFFPTPDGILVNHQSMGCGEVYFAPLKRAVVDSQGTLRLAWWEGNDKLKHETIESKPHPLRPSSRIAMLDKAYPLRDGLVLEGSLSLPASADAQPSGLYLDNGAGAGTAILIDHQGVSQIGPIFADGTGFKCRERTDREANFGNKPHFRLLVKGPLVEFYLNDLLIHCYGSPKVATGRIGMISSGSQDSTGKKAQHLD